MPGISETGVESGCIAIALDKSKQGKQRRGLSVFMHQTQRRCTTMAHLLDYFLKA